MFQRNVFSMWPPQCICLNLAQYNNYQGAGRSLMPVIFLTPTLFQLKLFPSFFLATPLSSMLGVECRPPWASGKCCATQPQPWHFLVIGQRVICLPSLKGLLSTLQNAKAQSRYTCHPESEKTLAFMLGISLDTAPFLWSVTVLLL